MCVYRNLPMYMYIYICDCAATIQGWRLIDEYGIYTVDDKM